MLTDTRVARATVAVCGVCGSLLIGWLGVTACSRESPQPAQTLAGDDVVVPSRSLLGLREKIAVVATSDPGYGFVRDIARGQNLVAFVESSNDSSAFDILKVIDLRTGGVAFEKTIPRNASAVDVSSDDRLVAVTENSSTRERLLVWEVQSGAPVLDTAAPDATNAVAFNSDGTKVVTAGFRLQVTDIGTGVSRSTEIEMQDGGVTSAESVTFTGADSVVAAGPEYYVTWRLSEQRNQYYSCGCSAWSVSPHSSGRVVFTMKSSVTVWRVDTGTVETSIQHGYRSTVSTLSADGSRLLILGQTEDQTRSRVSVVQSGGRDHDAVDVEIVGVDDTLTADGQAWAAGAALWGSDGTVIIARSGDGTRLERFLIASS